MVGTSCYPAWLDPDKDKPFAVYVSKNIPGLGNFRKHSFEMIEVDGEEIDSYNSNACVTFIPDSPDGEDQVMIKDTEINCVNLPESIRPKCFIQIGKLFEDYPQLLKGDISKLQIRLS